MSANIETSGNTRYYCAYGFAFIECADLNKEFYQDRLAIPETYLLRYHYSTNTGSRLTEIVVLGAITLPR